MTKKVKGSPTQNPLEPHPPSEQHSSLPDPSSSGADCQEEKGTGNSRRRKFITRMREFNPSAQLSVAAEQSVGDGVGSAREKNNLAARMSRRRKKLYIQLLQEQNTNLEMELYALNEEIEMLRTDIFNAIMHADELNSPNAQIQSLVLRKLRALSQQTPRTPHLDAEINICLDSCIYRIGSSGSERKAILDILYKGFINRHLPNNYRFILWSSLHTEHRPADHWWEFLQSELMREAYQRFLDEQGPSIAFKGKQILRCAQGILAKKREIEASGQLFDQLIKELRTVMSPAQFALLFLFTERATPKRELQIFDDRVQDVPDICQGSREQHSLASSAKKRKKYLKHEPVASL